jgi:NAD(P)-dependent dehydrogenase (short-subunit alcohol dehydrogenase family)
MYDFTDQTAVVTGAASGIGRQSAIRFAAEGASVAVLDVDVEGGEETAERAREAGGEAIFRELDVTVSADWEQTVVEVVDRFGGLDYVHNNAGIEGEQRPAADQTEDTWEAVVKTNAKGVWLGVKTTIPHLRKSDGDPAIVNTASTAGLHGPESISPYAASKHAVVGLTKSAARDYASEGLRVNAICPGPVDTPMVDRFSEVQGVSPRELMTEQVPLGRLADPAELAAVVVWLCSDEASFVNGHALLADGGELA